MPQNNSTLIQLTNTTTNYTYDRQGNLVYDGTSVYRYNGFNRLVGINSDHSNISYTYDHTGLRTSKTVNGVYTKLINDGQDVVAQYVDGKGSYFYRGINLIGYTNSYNDVNFYQFNAHGDVVSILDCFGNTVRNYDYDAFGKQRVNPKIVINSRRDDNPFRYCGEYFDSETNLIYLRARYYNPDLQRFLSEDPVKDGLNWYVYCGNNPVRYIDISGLDAIVITSSSAVGGAGHTSALYQDSDGEWYYTYWGMSGACVVYVPETYTTENGDEHYSMKSLENFNNMLEIVYSDYSIGGNYDRATYIEGDFTMSLEDARKDVHNSYWPLANHLDNSIDKNTSVVLSGWNPYYVLVGNNCYQSTLKNLTHGTLDNGLSVYTYISEYIVNTPYPVHGQSILSSLFFNESFTKSKEGKTALDQFIYSEWINKIYGFEM